MTVRDIIKLVCELSGEKEIAVKLAENKTLTTAQSDKVDLMTKCFNLVNQEIAGEYLPFMTTENIDVSNSILSFSNLSKTVVNIYAVKGRFNMNLKFKTYANYIEIFGNAKKIVYSYLPEDLTLDSEFELVNGLSARIYAYGVTSEFLLIDGLGTEAEIWEERFKESLFVLSRRRGEHLMPKRSWL